MLHVAKPLGGYSALKRPFLVAQLPFADTQSKIPYHGKQVGVKNRQKMTVRNFLDAHENI